MSVPNLSFLACLEVAEKFGVGWLETDNRAISVQLDLTGTLTGTELGNSFTTSDVFI